MIAETREDELNSLLSFIDSMGEDRPEPISPADVGFEALGKVWDENAKKDYQLDRALDILKAMSVVAEQKEGGNGK